MMSSNLVDLCLDSIVNHFAGYNLLFTTSDDFYVKKQLEFLQRKYSFDLLSRLHEKENLPEEFIDVLVNKYVKSLNTSWLTRCSWDKILSKMAEIGSNLEKIFFDHEHFDEFCEERPWRDIICHLVNLKSFTFHLKCDDSILKHVAQLCLNIEEIDIKNSNVTFESLKHFGEYGNTCATLKKLRFGKSKSIKAKDVQYLLNNLPLLEVCDHPLLPFVMCSMRINCLSFIDKVEPFNITTLNLSKCMVSGSFATILQICIPICPHLKYLTCGLLNEAELNYLFKLPDLEQLNIESFSDSKININNLLTSKGSKLTSLRIANCTVSVSVLAESCPYVRQLTLNNVNILGDEDSKSSFNSLSSLTFESFWDNANGMDLLLLSSLFKLESLSFENCQSVLTFPKIKVAILKDCELYPIKKLTFYLSQIEEEFIKELLCSNHTLNYLNVDVCIGSAEEDEILELAENLPNKPKISMGNDLYDDDDSDYEEIDSYIYNYSDSDY